MSQEQIPEGFRRCNPFEMKVVDEESIWAEREEEFRDVEAINRDVFGTLMEDIQVVRDNPDHPTKLRFVVGAPGSGKSHLFSRLRRQIGDEAVFCFAANPPTRPDSIASWILGKVVLGLKHRCFKGNEVRPYSQLHTILYELLMPRYGFVGGRERFHAQVRDSDDFFAESRFYLLEELPFMSPALRRALHHILHPDLSEVAFRWLSGSTDLAEDELRAIKQVDHLQHFGEGIGTEFLGQLGRVSISARLPIVLVVDQLDLLTHQNQLDELQRVFFELRNNSRNWYVVVSLVQDRFTFWSEGLAAAILQWIEVAPGVLPVSELQVLVDRDLKRSLIEARLSSPPLISLRSQYDIKDSVFPLNHDQIEELIGGQPIYARALIREASSKYQLIVTGAGERVPELMGEMQAEFEKFRATINENKLNVHKAVLADRLVELVDVVCAAQEKSFQADSGPLEAQPNFRGTDTVLTVAGREIRLLGHHIQQGPQFPSFLNHVLGLPRNTILVRDGKIPVSGTVTNRRLIEFKRDKQFIHLSRPEIADAYTLGQVLAEMREGNYGSLSTDPPPTDENIKRCLGRITGLAHNSVVRKVMDLVDHEAVGQEPEPTPTPPPPTPANLLDAVVAIMSSVRWLVLQRLERRLRGQLPEVTTELLKRAITSRPLQDKLLCYPPDIHSPADVHILVWNVEEGHA